jgi:hypothetical protein
VNVSMTSLRPGGDNVLSVFRGPALFPREPRGRMARRSGMRGRTPFIAVVAAALVMSGCARHPVPAGPAPDQPARIEQQARDALARWDRAIGGTGGPAFVPTQGLIQQVGEWEGETGYNNKPALDAGLLTLAVVLPGTAPPAGTVRWDDGTILAVPVAPATEAYHRILRTGQGSCPSCTPLVVTGATLTTMRLSTSRGTATVPAWEYTLRGTAVRIGYVAVDPTRTVEITPPPWDATDPPAGTSVDSAAVSADGRRLTLHFVGSPGPASQPCGADYTARAVESDRAVVAIVEEHGYTGPNPPQACTLIGAERTATLELSRPLGDRAVLEVRQGLPVPVTRG